MKVFVDVNIIMYAAGRTHPWKEPSGQLLERIGRGDVEAVTDTEVLQELLYRYWHVKDVAHGASLVDYTLGLLSAIFPVHVEDMVAAKTLLTQHPDIEPRDAMHAAVMLNHGMTQLYSYDRHFDRIPHLTRLEP